MSKPRRYSNRYEGAERLRWFGSGVDDAPALAQPDVGIAIGAGADVTIAPAEVSLSSVDLRSVS